MELLLDSGGDSDNDDKVTRQNPLKKSKQQK